MVLDGQMHKEHIHMGRQAEIAMRKIVYSLIVVFAALSLAGCSESLGSGPDVKDGSGLRFSVVVPHAGSITTRSFDAEVINSLYVLVFDESGYFVECQKAQPVNPGAFGTDMNVEYTFTVNLQASANRRILHFVANYDFEKNPVEYGTEYSVISHLTVGDGQEAYWQRVVLEKGIYLNESLENMPEKDKLVKIPLVRNFLKVEVESQTSEFEVTGFALWNVPDRGCVAPYVMVPPSFAVYGQSDADGDAFGNNPWISRTYDDLSKHFDPDDTKSDGYVGFLPKDAVIVNTDANALIYDMSTKYMYERPYSRDASHTAVIVKGKWNGNPESYFKIDLVKSSLHGLTEFYNLLRNFTYKVNILSCTDNGYSSAADAAAQPASNNFVASVVTQDILNISDGRARLYVSTTDTTIVTTDPFKFRYKYIPDFYGAPDVVDNRRLSFYDYTRMEPLKRDDASEYFVDLESPHYVMLRYNVIHEIDDPDSEFDQWHETTIEPAEPGDEEVSESVIIYEETADGSQVKIARTVIFRLRKPFTLIPECVPATVPTGVGRKVMVNLKVPSGLRESLFPLEFKMEAEDNSLSPDNSLTADAYRSGYMSAWYGESIIPSKSGKQSYGFTKRLFYNDYLNMALTSDNSYRIVPCAFVTTKSQSATKVWIQNKYFYFGDGQSTAEFGN